MIFVNKTNKLLHPHDSGIYRNDVNTYIFLTLSLGMCLFVVLVLLYRLIQCCQYISNNIFNLGVMTVYLLPKRVFCKDEDESEICKLCMEKYKNGDVIRDLPCKHSFHSNCILNYVRDNDTRRCPLCSEYMHLRNNQNQIKYQSLRADDNKTPSYGATVIN